MKVHPRTPARLSDQRARRLAPEEPLWGPPRHEVNVVEHGVRYLVRPAAGLSVGLFLDMRDVRQWLRAVVAGPLGAEPLCLYLLARRVRHASAGAQRVVNIDVSRPYLEWGKANYALTICAVDERDFVFGDAFDWLSRFARRSQAVRRGDRRPAELQLDAVLP